MEATTIKRNGVCIIFPTKEDVPIKENMPTSAIQSVRPPQIKQKDRRPNQHRQSVIRRPQMEGERCWHCGEPVWRNDVNYCWDCYKYENYESK